MTPEPTIKCVTLKNDVQATLQQATQDLAPEEITRRRRKKLHDSTSPLAHWWQRLTSRQPVSP